MPGLSKSIFLTFFLLFFCSVCVFAEDITITTYYPSPYGVYNTLRLYPNNNAAAGNPCANAGEMFYNQTANQVLVCNGATWQTLGGGAKISSGSYVGNGQTNQGIAHSLGVVPKFVMVIRNSATYGATFAWLLISGTWTGFDGPIGMAQNQCNNIVTAQDTINFYVSDANPCGANTMNITYYWIAIS